MTRQEKSTIQSARKNPKDRMSLDIDQKISQLQKDFIKKEAMIKKVKKALSDTTLKDSSAEKTVLPNTPIKQRKSLKGHTNKIYAISWSGDGKRLASVSQDGKVIVWNPLQETKEAAIDLQSTWTMSIDFARKNGSMIATGGLNDLCSIYDFEKSCDRPICELAGHLGFVSGLQFIRDDQDLISSSGDTTCILWDLQREKRKVVFSGHTADVMAVATLDENTFVSVGCDQVSRIWDVRTGECERLYIDQGGDLNCVCRFPTGTGFASGSDDQTVHIYDLRSDRKLLNLECHSSVTSVDFSASGRAILVAYDDAQVRVWDVLRGGEVVGILEGHDDRVSSIKVSPGGGNAVASAGWDGNLKIWA